MTDPPRPVGPYSPVLRLPAGGEWIICSGQVGVADGQLVAGGVGPQLVQAVANVEAILRGQGAALTDVVKTTVFLTDIGDFGALNEAYAAAFGDHRPTRSTVAVAGLPLGAAVEVEAWAYLRP